ncbi:MAG: DNA-3-methyladenine glycosylase 2 family protein [Oscillospiraceae bacterium]|nr:DNA-3-methyladenine glycosylase 2 family protein [Oscillospiraceae bacterium]
MNDFNIRQIFNCGQCFRFNENPDGSVSGIAFGKFVTFTQESEYNEFWQHYLSLDVDYAQIKREIIERFHGDPTIKAAIEYGSGIRILRQEPWEMVCSFIISQNNNIPRIKKIIAEMSRVYGEPIEGGYAFPTAEALYHAGIDGFAELKMGFRAKYVYDAAKKIVTGELNLDEVRLSSTQDALSLLQNVKGIGLKVASCALLFGFEKYDVFPIDVWVRRVIEKYYPNGLDIDALGEYAGIAQQYLFYYERYTNIRERTSGALG